MHGCSWVSRGRAGQEEAPGPPQPCRTARDTGLAGARGETRFSNPALLEWEPFWEQGPGAPEFCRKVENSLSCWQSGLGKGNARRDDPGPITQGRLQKINDLASVGLSTLRSCPFNRGEPPPTPTQLWL